MSVQVCQAFSRLSKVGALTQNATGRRSFHVATCLREAKASKFDAEQASLYNRIAEQHRHPNGPWRMMTEAAQANVTSISKPRILDLASGPGEPALTIAKALPNATVYSTDFSEDMVKAATKASEHMPNVTTLVVDMENLPSQFASDSLDAVTCCYGYMFPPDKVKALSETYRVLKPGGTLIATTWDNVGLLQLMRQIMQDVLGAPPPPAPQNPLFFREPELFETMLRDANFVDLEVTRSTYPFNFGTDAEMQFRLCTLLVKDKLHELGAWDVAKTSFGKHIDDYSTIDAEGNRVLGDNTFKMVVAKKAE